MQIVPYNLQETHRSGWRYAMSALHEIPGSEVFLDGFIEESHSWDMEQNLSSNKIPYHKPWIGFFHNPANMPSWYHPQDRPQTILERDCMQQSFKLCRGLFTLSSQLAEWLLGKTSLPVSSLRLPSEIPSQQFSLELFRSNTNPKIIQIGYWLRKLFAIQQLPTNAYEKIWLVPNDRARVFRDDVEQHNANLLGIVPGRYREISWVPHHSYDELLSRNLAFVELYDASACNAIVDCIARSTPLLVNPLPAVIEYLGENYPFYYSTLNEAAQKAESPGLIADAHEYLQRMDKSFLSADYFRQSFLDSEVFKLCVSTRAEQ